ncbi:AAWKG family protein, partial [Streptomyces sp. NPDC088788]|uniref:AAWKG family protein n=1 Tax=Streptomyces sp. NPDC088788 TaxID=3365898 RepID=UPI00382C5C90
MDNTPIDPGNDDWYRAVPVFTGYTPPSITDVLENLKSYDGTPLMHVTIKKADNNDLPELEETNWQEQNFYNEIGAMNFNVPFYLYGGRDPKKYVANIQLIGIQDTKTAINSGGSAGSFKSEGANAQESKWDTTKLAQYSYGTGAALDWLLTKPHGTRGFDWSPAVTDETYVDPSTFEKTALAFDRFRHFVGQRKDVAESWKKTFGETEDEKWKGQAAGVWWNLTHLIIRRYERLSEDMTDVADRSVGLHGITGSRQASAIRYAGLSFLDEAEKLHDAWSDWLGYEKYDGSFNPSPNCNPLFYLTRILNQVMNNIWYDNIFKVNYVGDPVYDDSSGYTSLSSGYNPGVDRGPQMQYGFTSVARDDDCSYGELDNPETWKAIGQEAVERWWRDIRKQLGEPGEAARKRLRSAFGDATGDVGEIRAAGGQDLTQSLQQDQADRDKKVAADEKAKQEQLSKDTQEKYDKQREDDLARANAEQDRQEKLRKEQEAKAQKQRQEDLASQKAEQGRQDQIRKAQEAKADEQRAEDLGRQTRMEHEQKEKEKEQEAQQQEQQRRQEQEQHRQEAEQEAKEKQQEAKQDRIRAEQEAKQEEAQRRQEQQQSQQMIQQRIMQERERKEQKEREREQQRRQDEQEQRQEELQREQEAKQEQQQRHQEQREDAQQRRQEELQKEQEQR